VETVGEVELPLLRGTRVAPLLHALWMHAGCVGLGHTQIEKNKWKIRANNKRTVICSAVHVSRFTLRTLLMCTPRLRWMPEQRMQKNTPRLIDAQRGPE
jgi:hypothetical protein